MTSRRSLIVACVLLAGTVTACTPTPPAQSPGSTVTPTPSVTPSVSPTVTATPAAATPTCETLLGPEHWATTEGHVRQVSVTTSPLGLFEKYGGTLCAWFAGDEIDSYYGFSAISEADQAAQEARLTSEGYTATSVDGGTRYAFDPAQNATAGQYFFRDGMWWTATWEKSLDTIITSWPGR